MLILHHFTTVYTSWANGYLEHQWKAILSTARATSSKWKMPAMQQPSQTEAIQKVTTHLPEKRSGRTKTRKLSRSSYVPQKTFSKFEELRRTKKYYSKQSYSGKTTQGVLCARNLRAIRLLKIFSWILKEKRITQWWYGLQVHYYCSR